MDLSRNAIAPGGCAMSLALSKINLVLKLDSWPQAPLVNTGMEWWLKALLTMSGVSGAFTANYCYNQYYEKRGLEHPITRWIRVRIANPEEDRRKRIEEVAIQSALAESRLKKLTNVVRFRYKDADSSSKSISALKPVASEAWKSDFE